MATLSKSKGETKVEKAMISHTEQMMNREAKAIAQTYTRQPLLLVRGKGAKVWDDEGKEYLDFVAGIAVNNVGHCHPSVVSAINEQAQILIHTSNLYYTEKQILLAEELESLTGMDKAFFGNSGAESVEAALKLARRSTGKPGIVAAIGSFHGRTMGALGTTYKSAYREPFRPLNEATFVEYGNPDALSSAIGKDTGAVILEPVQGESGVHVPPDGYLKAARDICDDKGLLLILDEVQTGFGRTGKWFGKEHSGVVPDIMTLAKGVAGGLPMGIMLAKDHVASSFQKGDHASTFGGGPLVSAAALATIDVIKKEKLVERSHDLGLYLRSRLADFNPVDIRGLGLMTGIDIPFDSKDIVTKARESGLLINNTGDHTLRLVPPLVITKEEIDRGVEILAEVFKQA